MSVFGHIFNSMKLPFGLDIGYTSVRAVQLERRGKLIHLTSYGEVPLDKSVFANNKIDTMALSLAIRQVMENSKINPITSKQVVCALPDSHIFTKVLQFPKMLDEELEEVIKLEVEKIIPFSISELYLDWERVKTGDDKNNEKDNILVVAAPQKLIHSHLEAIKKAGLEVIAMEIEPAAVCRALINKSEGINEGILIADIGADITSIVIYDFASIQLTGSTHVAGDTLTQGISQYLDIDFEKAEHVKRNLINSGKKMHPKLFNNHIKPVLSQLERELSRSIDYYGNFAKNPHPISKIIFCGGNAHLPGIVDFFEKTFNIRTEIGNPWANITTYPLKAIPKLKTSIYSTAIGLALRELVEK
ncbi:hypothetical protein COZ97_00285 [bacterium CG_4_8_14_3_um_filter_33_28]|nr:MAG: hypothetical protein COU50_04255 [bacterium CG10_big_fil_rev_8_21_14_0_10_33_18]PIW81734.1 MAG: hypothetical protein COZ97_00285 [bacterium CG_4_8_14_3_um_filter_33_28]